MTSIVPQMSSIPIEVWTSCGIVFWRLAKGFCKGVTLSLSVILCALTDWLSEGITKRDDIGEAKRVLEELRDRHEQRP